MPSSTWTRTGSTNLSVLMLYGAELFGLDWVGKACKPLTEGETFGRQAISTGGVRANVPLDAVVVEEVLGLIAPC